MTPEAAVTRIRAEIAALPRHDTPHLREVRKAWSDSLRSVDPPLVLAIAQALEAGSAQETKWIAYELIRGHKAAFAAVTPEHVEDFADRIASWYATDAFGTGLAGPLWAQGRLPDALFDRWSASSRMWLRRCALTATVGLNASLPGSRGDPSRTFPICLRMADDREDMIEKAVSWALRYLSQKDRAAVAAFMAEHGGKFRPRIRREVRHKLTNGVKSGRARRSG